MPPSRHPPPHIITMLIFFVHYGFGLFWCYYVKSLLSFKFLFHVCGVFGVILCERLFFFIRGCSVPYSDLLNSKLGDLSTTAGNAVADLAGVVAGADVLASQFADVKNALEDLQQFVNEFKGGYYYTPTGAVVPFAGADTDRPPAGWLVCDGSAVSQTTYAALFAVIGATYDVTSPGAGNFRVPDLRGRTLIGVGAASSGATLTGTLGGVQGVNGGSTTLTSSHIPEHTHNLANHTHNFDRPYHNTSNTPFAAENWPAGGGAASVTVGLSAGWYFGGVKTSTTTGPSSNTSGAYGTASPTAVSAVQPSVGLNYLIKA
jgi:microcystin-dependent protein